MKGVELFPEGTDEDGWMMFRTSLGHIIRVRDNDKGGIDLRYPMDKYELKELYNVESTGEVVIDLRPKGQKEA